MMTYDGSLFLPVLFEHIQTRDRKLTDNTDQCHQKPHLTNHTRAVKVSTDNVNSTGKNVVKNPEPLNLTPEKFIEMLSSGKEFTSDQPVIVNGDIYYTQTLERRVETIRQRGSTYGAEATHTDEYSEKFFLNDKSPLIALPEDLKIVGNLNLSCSPGLTKLPRKLTVTQNCYIASCKNLENFSKDMIVHGSLYLGACRS